MGRTYSIQGGALQAKGTLGGNIPEDGRIMSI
jgi:hypothetical protein